MSTLIKFVLKLVFASALIYWLVDSGKLNFSLLKTALNDPLRLFIGVIFLIMIIAAATWRFYLILKSRSNKDLSFKEVFKLNWIGIFFNSILPGSVSGDVVKIYYLKELDKSFSKKFLFAAVLIDRLTGLFGLLIIMGIITLLNYSYLSTLSSELNTIIKINFLLLALVILFFLIIFTVPNFTHKLIAPLERKKYLYSIAQKITKLWDGFLLLKDRILISTLISVVIQSFSVFTFWYITAPYSDGSFELGVAYSFVPLGFIVLAFPIAPSGLGVGHAAFANLFSYIGIDNGASLFNIFFLLTLITNLIGFVPYIFVSKKS